MKRKFTKSPVLAGKSDGLQVAKRMYQNRADALRQVDNDDYRYLRDLMNQEVEDLKSQGIHWSEYKPSSELRAEAKSRGYSIDRVRAKGAFPYCIGHRTYNEGEVSASTESQQGTELDVDEFEEMIDGDDFNELNYQGKDAVEEQLYEEEPDIDEVCGGDAGIIKVIQTSETSFIVTVEANIEYLDSYGDEADYSGTVNLAYDMTTHEITLVE